MEDLEAMSEEKLTEVIKKWLNITSKELFESFNIDDYQWPEIIEHVQERIDGSSDGLLEKRDGPNGECTNWNYDLTVIWTLDQLYPQWVELSPELEVKVYNIMKGQLYSAETKFTSKDERIVFKKTQQFLNEIKKSKLK